MLCVFDDPLFLDRICRNLEQGSDLFVEISVSVEDALHLMVYVHFDVIVTDCTSWRGEQNGFISEVQKQGKEIPFIYFIRGAKSRDGNQTEVHGRARYVVWDERDPFPPFDLLEQCIREIVAQGCRK